jgi:beta-lactamase regulating signal transducer with metallopeptidase domain
MNELLVSVAETGPGLAIRATVLLAVASGVSLALARASAAQRHLVWAAALAASLVLPVMHVCAPEWGVLPAFTAKQTSSPAMREAPMAGESPSASMAVASFQESPRGAERAVSAAVSPPALPPVLPAPPKAAAFAVSVSVGQALAVLWLTGVILGCVRLTLAAGRIRQLARRADPATGRMAALLAELARESGIRRPVQGLVSRQSIVPMTWGWLRPVVLLPADAASWSAARLRVVLLHELAHVRRGDAATQFVAELARSLYWFHPLSWWGVRCLRVEQEAACDDRVLAAGAAAEDYAEELVAVTARLPHGLQAAGLAVAMGRRHTIEGRVRGILADDRDRRPVRMLRAALIGGVFAMLATVAAIVGPAADAEDAPAGSGTRPHAADAAASTGPQDPLLGIRRITPEEAARIIREKREQVPYSALWDGRQRGPDLKAAAKARGFLEGMGFTEAQVERLRQEIDALGPRAEQVFPVWSGVSPDLVVVLNRCSTFLFLPALESLDEATAAALVGEEEFGRSRLDSVHDLYLPGLVSLDAPTARALARGTLERVDLSGLRSIDAETAKALTSGNLERLDLSGLRSLDAETARELAKGTIQRDGGGSRRLAGLKSLDLSGLESLDAATARALADGDVETLVLSGLRSLDTEAAKALGAKGNWQQLDLRGVRSLDVDTAKALCREVIALNGELNLSGLQTLDAGTAAALVTGDQCFRLDLSGLRSLDAETARALMAGSVDRLDLSGLRSIDIDTAKALANRKQFRSLTLAGLTALDADTAGGLMSGEGAGGTLRLPGLLALDAKTAAALARGGAFYLGLSGLQSLDAETAEALTNGKASDPARRRDFDLSGIRSLQPAAAEALVKGLDCRTCHATATLPELLRSNCTNYFGPQPTRQRLFVQGRIQITPAGIADDMPEDTDTIESLTVQQAQKWARDVSRLLLVAASKSESFTGSLPGVTSFDFPDSVAIAKALATRKGPLSLPNLKKISPKTLSALIEKDDIDIPLIETLELIPEPDGSPTEDFVIPERFQKR